MAMLAEPRQRKRYNLMPKGKALYEDGNRFGTKMLEKMGWEKGQGLGAKNDGSKDFVRIRYKNDALGLGFEERDDQWTQHEESFNGLLKNLNNGDDSTACEENDKAIESESEMPLRAGFGFEETNKTDKTKAEKLKEKISGVSLEERSKQSKARVHYKKFTKGKDLAQYSEKDLANIFGKKAVDEQQSAANDFYQNLNNTLGESREISSGVQIINTGVSVNDYFKTKIESRVGNNSKSNEVPIEENSKECNTKATCENAEEKEKGTQIFYSNLSVNDYFKKKMEDLKKCKNKLSSGEDVGYDKNLPTEEPLETPTKKKKKSKKETKDQEDDCLPEPVEKKFRKNKHVSSESDELKNEAQVLKKDKKSKKCKLEEMDEVARGEGVEAESEDRVSEKQKNQSRVEKTVDVPLDKSFENCEKIQKTKKSDIDDVVEINCDDCIETKNEAEGFKKIKKSKSKKVKELGDQGNCESSEIVDIVAEETQNKSKKCDEEVTNHLNETKTESESIRKVKKSKSKKISGSADQEINDNLKDNDAEKTQNKSKRCDVEETADLPLGDSAETGNEVEVIKKVKKSKSKKIKDTADQDNCESIKLNDNDNEKTENKSKKCNLEEMVDLNNYADTNSEAEGIKKGRRSKKCQVEETAQRSLDNNLLTPVEIVVIDEIETNSEVIKKKDKSKKRVFEESNEFPCETTNEGNKSQKERQLDIDSSNIATALARKSDNSRMEIEAPNEAIEPLIEIDLTQEPQKKKKRKNKCKENIEIINLDESCAEEISHNTDNQVLEEKTNTGSNSIKISSAKNICVTEDNFQVFDLEEIKNQYQAFNIYPISSFCAEKFRNINITNFTGSTLPQLEGYGLSSDLQLDVKYMEYDEERITRLWKCVLNKYIQLGKSKKTYRQYFQNAIRARRSRKKLPKLNVKSLKRKNVFQAL